MTNEFTITKVSWHTEVEGNPESREHIIDRFWAFTNFLQSNKLTKHILATSKDNIDDEFCIKSSDLTERGLELIKKCYDKWLTKVDKGMSPDDMTIFLKELEKGK